MADGSGTIFDRETGLVIVHDGRRGPPGPKGDAGGPGPQGASIRALGAWQSGAVYAPGDAVSARSSLVDNVQSLYVQKNGYPTLASTQLPHTEPDRWMEIGATDFDSAFGGIWTISQINHGFTKVGQPVGYSWQSGNYVLADARREDELAVGVVREVIDADHAILQSSGEVPKIDPTVIYPDGSSWQPGRIYYVSNARGQVSLEPPEDLSAYVNPILMATDSNPAGGRNGIALPWTPVSGAKREYVAVGLKKFYFTLAEPTSTITGADDNTELLVYSVGDVTDVFVDGVNLWHDEYTAIDGREITFPAPLPAGTRIEVWTPDRPLDLLVKSTTLKVDNIEDQFDGIQTDFDLTYNSEPVVFQDATSLVVTIDGIIQEPTVDFTIEQSVGNIDHAAISFFEPPDPGARFWAIALTPSGQQGLPNGGATGAFLVKLSAADGDVGWTTTIHGGSF